MIQLNLLPDIKLEYIRAQKTRRIMTVASVLSVGGSVALLVILLGLSAVQKHRVSTLADEISQKSAKLANTKNASKIITVQNQLNSLASLHDQKPNVTRLFDYLNQTTPGNVAISDFKADFAAKKLTITGGGQALSDVNKYVDTLKYTQYKSDGNTEKAFSNVVLGSFGLTNGSINGLPASFTVTLDYDPVIFDNTKSVQLIVPDLITTRTSSLFQTAAPKTSIDQKVE